MLSDSNKDIRQQSHACLSEFLREIRESVFVHLGPMIPILLQRSEVQDSFIRQTVLLWTFEFISLGKDKLAPFYAPMMSAALSCIADTEENIRLKAHSVDASLLKLVEETQRTENFDVEPLLNAGVHFLKSVHAEARKASLRWIAMLLRSLLQLT